MEATESCTEHINSAYGPSGPIAPSIPSCEKILTGIISDLTQEYVLRPMSHDVTLIVLRSSNDTPMCPNMYDVRLTDTYPACGMNWPPDLPDIIKYLGVRREKIATYARP